MRQKLIDNVLVDFTTEEEAEADRIEMELLNAPIKVPETISRFRAKAILYNSGLLQQIEDLMSNPATPMLAKIAWTDAVEFERNSPTILAMTQALGWSAEFVDTLFIEALSIVA